MRRPTWIVVLGMILVLGSSTGCTVHLTSSRPPDIAHSRLVDGTLTLDLRRHPTRDDVGMNATTSFAGYGSTDRPIQVVVDLPGATLTFPRTDITFATDDAGGGNDPEPARHQPRFFTLYVHYPDRAAARADALAKAPALGLRAAQVDEALADPSGEHDVYGVPDDWLSARLGFSHLSDQSSYTGFYFLDLDVYRNPVLDAIKHDDTVDLDLRTAPSREALGFLPYFPSTRISPDPGHRLTLRLRTPEGSAQLQLDTDEAFDAVADRPDGPPTSSYLSTCGSPARLRSGLLRVADVLGLDRDRIDSLPTTRSSPAPTLTLTGRTSTFGSRLEYDGTDQLGLDACAKLVLTY